MYYLRDLISDLMKEERQTTKQVARELGEERKRIYDMMYQNCFTMAQFMRIINVLGWKLSVTKGHQMRHITPEMVGTLTVEERKDKKRNLRPRKENVK